MNLFNRLFLRLIKCGIRLYYEEKESNYQKMVKQSFLNHPIVKNSIPCEKININNDPFMTMIVKGLSRPNKGYIQKRNGPNELVLPNGKKIKPNRTYLWKKEWDVKCVY